MALNKAFWLDLELESLSAMLPCQGVTDCKRGPKYFPKNLQKPVPFISGKQLLSTYVYVDNKKIS